MRITLSIIAIGIIILGFLLIARSFDEPAPPPASAPQTIANPKQQSASPFILGLALLSGGVVFLVMVCRRK